MILPASTSCLVMRMSSRLGSVFRGVGVERVAHLLTFRRTVFTLLSLSSFHLPVTVMSFQEDDLHLVKVGDQIINVDHIDFVKFKAEEKHGPSRGTSHMEAPFER